MLRKNILRKNLLLGATIATASLLNVANAYTLKASAAKPAKLIASEVDLGVSSADYEMVLEFAANTLGDGAMFLDVTLTGGKYGSALMNTALGGCIKGDVVRNVSSGGKKDDTTVRFRIEGAGECSGKKDAAAMTLKLPIGSTVGGTPLTVTTNLTDANVDNPSPIDGGYPSADNPLKLIDYLDAYSVEVVTPGGKSVYALLGSTPKFSGLGTKGTSTSIDPTEIGRILFAVKTENKVGGKKVDLNLAKDIKAPAAGDFTKVVYTITGDFSFAKKDTTEKKNQKQLTTEVAGGKVAYADDYASATVTYGTVSPLGDKIYISGKSEVPFNASDYTITVAYELARTDISFAKQSPTAGALASVVREGTTLTFPWVSSATQGASSGSTNIIRIGNLTSSALGAVSARVKNSTKSTFKVKPVTTDLVASVPANGELVITSATLEAKLGDWGRGDVEIIVEETAKSITANRLVVSGNRIVNVDAGKADKYND